MPSIAACRRPPAPSSPGGAGVPGWGRKLLAFADSRQSAAYFAPYLQNTSEERVMRRLVAQAVARAASRLGGEVDAGTLLSQMLRIGDEQGLFPPSLNRGQQQERWPASHGGRILPALRPARSRSRPWR